MKKNIIWFFSVRSGQIRNGESARVSMPGQLRRYILNHIIKNVAVARNFKFT
jgi:hypothetical protein